MYGFTNEAGEPIMSGEAYRFEQQLDADSAAWDYEDTFYGSFTGDEPDWCHQCGEEGHEEDDCPGIDDGPDEPEDAWLDGS